MTTQRKRASTAQMLAGKTRKPCSNGKAKAKAVDDRRKGHAEREIQFRSVGLALAWCLIKMGNVGRDGGLGEEKSNKKETNLKSSGRERRCFTYTQNGNEMKIEQEKPFTAAQADSNQPMKTKTAQTTSGPTVEGLRWVG